MSKKESRNFWNTCPRNLDYLPEKPCAQGKPKLNSKGEVTEEPKCPWNINSEKDCYCFWKYIKTHSTPEGKMDDLNQKEISELLDCSLASVHILIRDGIKNLKNKDNSEVLEELNSEEIGAELPSVRKIKL